MNDSWLSALVIAVTSMPVWIGGVIVAVVVVAALYGLRRVGWTMSAALVSVAFGLSVVLALFGVLAHTVESERIAERRALESRAAEVTGRALASNSPLSCLVGDMGEAIENACEKVVFASPESAAAAVTFVAARLALLQQADAALGKNEVDRNPAFVGLRRSLQLDRFGIAAHVISMRESCSDNCASLSVFSDPTVVKANIKAQAFAVYVGRYAPGWAAGPAPSRPDKPAESSPQAGSDDAARQPTASRYDFPSAASIPPVSIMASEPPRTAAGAAAPGPAQPPVPPRRPTVQTDPEQ